MANSDEIVVTEEAHMMMSALQASDPGAPAQGDLTAAVTGPTSSYGAQRYRLAMQNFLAIAHDGFGWLLDGIQDDSSNAVAAINDLSRQDEEIVMLLKRYDEETATAAAANEAAKQGPAGGGGGPQIAPPADGGGLTQW